MGNEGNRIVGTTRAMQVQVGQLWEQIGISNDFLFGKLMRSRPGLCRKLLQRVLPELDIARIELIETQKTIREDQDARGVRLDVYVRDEADRVYSIDPDSVGIMIDSKYPDSDACTPWWSAAFGITA